MGQVPGIFPSTCPIIFLPFLGFFLGGGVSVRVRVRVRMLGLEW